MTLPLPTIAIIPEEKAAPSVTELIKKYISLTPEEKLDNCRSTINSLARELNSLEE